MTPPHDETKMSNRERAVKLYFEIEECKKNHRMECLTVGHIERAIDEKDAEWSIKNAKSLALAATTYYSAGQKEMRERAIASLEDAEYSQDIIKRLRALDEAEKRGSASRCDLGFNDGYVSGQKEMRERAAKLTEKTFRPDHVENAKEECLICGMSDMFTKAIRALPIEGE